MKETESVDDFASKIGGIVSKFRALGETIDEKVKVKKLFNSAPTKFLPIIASIEQFVDLDITVFEEVVGRLKAYEERLKPAEPAKDSAGQLLLTKSQWQKNYKAEVKQVGRGRGSNFVDHRGHGRGRGRGRSSSRGRGGRYPSNNNRKAEREENNQKRDKRNLRCYNCDKAGHFTAECHAPKRNDGESYPDQANLAQEDDPTLLMVMDEVMLNEEKVFPSLYAKDDHDDSTWYLDNGASNHMTGRREFFSELNEEAAGRVRFEDGSAVEIKGRGSILLQCENSDQKLVSNVYYIPNLCNNILSLGKHIKPRTTH